MNLLVRPETDADRENIRAVNRLAFGRDDEGRLVDALRQGGYVKASLVAEKGGVVVGHILFSDLPIVCGSKTTSAVSLAPMAVLPECQRRGIGSELVWRGLQVCKAQGHDIVIVLGHPEYYPRFGFSSELAVLLKSPFSGEAWMAMELTPGALNRISGTVKYPPPFNIM